MMHLKDAEMDAGDQADSLIVDDETLLSLISAHDEGALSSLYERYSRLLYAVALRITGDSGSAEECTQDVFQAVWLRAAQFRASAGSVQAWLSAIARYRAIDEVRSRWHRGWQSDLSFEGLPDWHSAVERGWEQISVLRADLSSALSSLPVKQRQAIELAFYSDMTTSEIASPLGESAGTIKSRLRLGLERLRDAANVYWEVA
jgi:RNA polymerase sigma-70 factor (ECF subfamily)